MSFNHPIRVYWEDTDGGGIVYYANYLKFAERARTEWLRALGFDQSHLKAEAGIQFVVREANIRYRQPARLDDELLVSVQVENFNEHKIELSQKISVGDQLCAELAIELVVVEANGGRLAKLPDAIRSKLA